MALSLFRRVIDRAWLKGPAHEPVEDGNYAHWRDAQADNYETIRVDVKTLKFVRDPENTPLLDDLEREFGVNEDTNLTEAERRTLLKPERYKKATNASDDDLQTRLDNGGFNLTVYNNSPDGPAIDPAILLDQNFQMQAGDQTNDFAGQDEAYAGRLGGDLLVNSTILLQAPAFFGADDVWAGNDNAVAGYFEKMFSTEVDYPTPTDPNSWPFVFFVGGDATFNPDGSIATIEQGFVPSTQQKKLETMILKFKPLFTWAGMIVTYT